MFCKRRPTAISKENPCCHGYIIHYVYKYMLQVRIHLMFYKSYYMLLYDGNVDILHAIDIEQSA